MSNGRGSRGGGGAAMAAAQSHSSAGAARPSTNVNSFMNDLSKLLTSRVSQFLQSHSKRDPLASKFEITHMLLGRSTSGLMVDRAGPGLITCRIDLVGWATQNQESFSSAAGVALLKACLLSMVNGTLGQRGLLLRKVQAHNLAVRSVGMVVEFSVWLPSTERPAADQCYAECVKDTMNRLSLKEIQQYFPSFLFGASGDGKAVELPAGSMFAMPMAAPAAVPEENENTTLASPKDACEMLFCTTKQKKRKGVPYCGTCRKFMEETVKWYCDTYRVHPAKEKDKFVPAVRNERYGCRHPKVGNCDCKSCHSLRRFDELYPNCESKLDEFKRRTFMFNDKDVSESSKTNSRCKAAAANAARHTTSQKQAAKSAGGLGTPNDASNPFINLGISPKDKVKPSDIFGDNFGQLPAQTLQQHNRKRKMQPPQSGYTSRRPAQQQKTTGGKTGRKPQGKAKIESQQRRQQQQQPVDDSLDGLLPNYILPTPSPGAARETAYSARESAGPSFSTTAELSTPVFEMDADALYRAMYMEDPDTFSALETMTNSAPTMNTWLCTTCAVWNHRSRQHCNTCNTARI